MYFLLLLLVMASLLLVQLKEEVREDPRYKAVARAEREQVFNDFLAKWKGGKESEVEVRASRKHYRFPFLIRPY